MYIQCRAKRKHQHKKTHKSGTGDKTMFNSHLIIKQQNQNKVCRLQMAIRYKPDELTLSNSVDPVSQVKVDLDDKSCYCKYIEELPQQNECESLLQDKQVQVSVNAYKEELIKDNQVEDKRCVHSCYKEDDKKKKLKNSHKQKDRRLRRKRNLNSQPPANKSIKGDYGYQVEDNLSSYVRNGMPVWWISYNRYKLERCHSEEECEKQCLKHCGSLKTQTLDLYENMVSNTQAITAMDAIKPLDC